jgi:hypothetical protein
LNKEINYKLQIAVYTSFISFVCSMSWEISNVFPRKMLSHNTLYSVHLQSECNLTVYSLAKNIWMVTSTIYMHVGNKFRNVI